MDALKAGRSQADAGRRSTKLNPSRFDLAQRRTTRMLPSLCSMAPFLFRCPNTGFRVQGWAADDRSDDDRESYESTTCHACGGLHLVNPKTGDVLGSDDE
jgi:hypothetical protein